MRKMRILGRFFPKSPQSKKGVLMEVLKMEHRDIGTHFLLLCSETIIN